MVYENERVESAAEALNSGNMELLGALMDASHSSLRDLYEVSCPELDFLMEELQALDGVYGARMTGAGFGGCVISLVDADAIPSIEERLIPAYKSTYNRKPSFLEVSQNLEAGAEKL